MLFFGARAPEELPYFGPLMKLPHDFIDINLAFSRVPGPSRKPYVQDLIRARGADVARLLDDAEHLRLRLRPEGDGRRRRCRRSPTPAGSTASTGTRCCRCSGRAGRYHVETY